MHVLLAHIPEYLANTKGTNSVLDMSSGSLEQSNKFIRAAILNKAYKGDRRKLLDDCLRHGHISSLKSIRKHLENWRTIQHCSICESDEHIRTKCPDNQGQSEGTEDNDEDEDEDSLDAEYHMHIENEDDCDDIDQFFKLTL